MQKEFTKADLKDGMVVEQRDGNRYLVLGERFVNKSGYNQIIGYENDLKWNSVYAGGDIVNVYRIIPGSLECIEEVFCDDNLELIYERKESKELTVEEMKQELEELTGYKIEVKVSREFMIFRLDNYCNKHNCTNCIFGGDRCRFHSMSNANLEKTYKEMMQHEHGNGIK